MVTAFPVIVEFPEHLILLKGSKENAELGPRIPKLTSLMERRDMSNDISEMFAVLNNPIENGQNIRAQLENIWANANDARAGMIEGAEDILNSLPEMAEQMFSPDQLGIIRTNAQ